MRNEYEVRGNVTAVFLRKRDGTVLETLIDTADLSILRGVDCRWSASWSRQTNSYYVTAKVDNKQTTMNYFLFGRPKGYFVDHINHDTLDNRRSVNLRAVTNSQNQQNRVKPNQLSKSGMLGVHWRGDIGKWRVRITVNGRKVTIGYFEDVDQAKLASLKARADLMDHSSNEVGEPSSFARSVEVRTIDTPKRNNKSGHKGVYWSNSYKRWVAHITVNRKHIHLGSFTDLTEAANVAAEARRNRHKYIDTV